MFMRYIGGGIGHLDQTLHACPSTSSDNDTAETEEETSEDNDSDTEITVQKNTIQMTMKIWMSAKTKRTNVNR